DHGREHEECPEARPVRPVGRDGGNTWCGDGRLGGGPGVLKDWYVAAFGKQDHPWVGAALVPIIFVEARPEPPGFGPHNGIAARIVIGAPSENLDRDDRLLQLLTALFEDPLYNEPEHTRELLAAGKKAACQH